MNGVEIGRRYMPTGTIDFDTFVNRNCWGWHENEVTTFSLPAGVLTAGENLIAVEVHQDATNSSGVSFDASLQIS